MSFGNALTGLWAATFDLETISNNIANSNTTGYKAHRAHFAELVSAGQANSRSIGDGTNLFGLSRDLNQGQLEYTNNTLDMSISGSGYFRLSDNGAVVYSRAGNFSADKDGYIINAAGHRLTGYSADANGAITGQLADLQIPNNEIPPRLSSVAELGVNLDASAVPPAASPFDPTNSESFNFSTPMTIYDSQGMSHTLNVYYVKGAAANAWNIQATVDGTSPSHVTFPTSSLAFNTDGSVDTTASPQPMAIDIDLAGVMNELGTTNGAAVPLSMTLDFSKSTQFGSPFGTNNLSQDGYANGQLSGIEVDVNGVIIGRYSNGRNQALGQVALADFRAPQMLVGVGDTAFAETFSSGPPLVGAPGSASLGALQSGTLETSNVELTEELVNMIETQRNYQANAQVISTADTMAQTIINLR